jgi:pimeloyl-ACP methyl ester carboxylesterase
MEVDKYVCVRGLRLHYVDYGGQGDVVLALHGLVQHARAFDPIAPLLIPHVRFLSLDLRGRGESEWGPPEAYRMFEYLKDLRAFLNELGLDRVGLIGTSLGGWVAMLFATAYPRRVTHLVLNDVAMISEAAGLNAVANRPSVARFEFEDSAEAISWFISDRPGLDRLGADQMRLWVEGFLSRTETGKWRFKCDPCIVRDSGALAQRLAGARDGLLGPNQAWEQAKRLTMPVLLLRGALSSVVSPAIAKQLTSVLPSARSVDIPGVGHSPTLYEPEAQAALLEFFGTHAGARAACELN